MYLTSSHLSIQEEWVLNKAALTNRKKLSDSHFRQIDSHQHFWDLSQFNYHWLTPDLIPLYRNFLPKDIQIFLEELNIEGTILIQAAPVIAETFFLLDLAEKNPFILGVVGWVDLLKEDACDVILKLSKHPKFCGIRPMLQDIPDVDWILKKELIAPLKTLAEQQGTFDALVLPTHLPHLIRLVEHHPNLRIVIDHGAKPLIHQKLFEPWASDIKTLSQFPQVFCKLSGLITETGIEEGSHVLVPYIQHLFNCFGAKRLMWGSDYPVLNLKSDYQTWYHFCYNIIKEQDKNAIADIFGQTAAYFYQV